MSASLIGKNARPSSRMLMREQRRSPARHCIRCQEGKNWKYPHDPKSTRPSGSVAFTQIPVSLAVNRMKRKVEVSPAGMVRRVD